jgi:hypothetical protein
MDNSSEWVIVVNKPGTSLHVGRDSQIGTVLEELLVIDSAIRERDVLGFSLGMLFPYFYYYIP